MAEDAKNHKIYLITDGACSGNPGPGGFGVVMRFGAYEKELYGYVEMTTNNQMELLAVICGLKALTRTGNIVIVTDSKYVLQGATQWMTAWIKKGWKTASNQPVKNKNLWVQLNTLLSIHPQVTWEWIKGHTGHPDNERADLLAREAIVKQSSNVKFSLDT